MTFFITYIYMCNKREGEVGEGKGTKEERRGSDLTPPKKKQMYGWTLQFIFKKTEKTISPTCFFEVFECLLRLAHG
jgi:hypothetical protein